MSATFNGGPITADIQPDGSGGLLAINGLSKREWFAGMALQGAAQYVNQHDEHHAESLADIARESYLIADAMIAAGKGES